MALLHSFRGELPNDRVELYQWTVDLLLRRWESRHVGEKGILESLDMPGLKMTDLEAGFHAVAFDIHAGSGSGDGAGEIREGDLRQRLAPFLNDSWDKAGEFVKYVHDRAGLLIRHKKAAYTFPHRTFQEFLAACHLVGMDDYPTQSARLLCENPDRWRIVYILAAGYAARTHRLSAAIGSIDALFSHCKDQDACHGRPMDHLAAIAGEALLEIGLVGVRREPTGRRRLKKVRQWLLAAMANDAHLAAPDRVAAGNVLSLLGDPRFSRAQYFLPGDVNLGFVDIPAGTFQMGSDKQADPSANDDELPRHPVVLSDYQIARYPVTVAQYRMFATATGRALDSDWLADNQYDNHPVVEVTWHDAMAYCAWLTAKLFVKGTIALPTEAQWERAARGADGRVYLWGDEKIDPVKANYLATGISSTSPVGCFPKGASANGLFDLSGNVWEWCQDWYGKYPRKTGPDPTGPSDGSYRVLRGGAWYNPAEFCRAAFRYWLDPGYRFQFFGFRLVCLPGQPGEPGK
ncbi:formylglycine-generating enzyme family protein [Desulfosarcina ovata]|nr:formylglycine-generating enzyme family protein [Desulfosarcina ovata]